jgi:hypothetical protein
MIPSFLTIFSIAIIVTEPSKKVKKKKRLPSETQI